MSLKQISVFLENRPGTLKDMTAVLTENRIDMRALSLAETKDFGIARLIVDDAYHAANVLKDAGFVSSLTSVVGVMIPDEVGGLDRVLEILQENHVNVEYMYAFLGGKKINHAYMILRVTDHKAAETALSGNHFRIVTQDEISEL